MTELILGEQSAAHDNSDVLEAWAGELQVELEGFGSTTFQGCNPALKADYCDIRFVNVTGALTVSSRLDQGNNQCKQASLDLATGELVSCIDTPCAAM